MPKRSRLKLPLKEYKLLCIEVFERDKWKCVCCKNRNNLHCHHIIFRSHGGDDASWNLLTVCNDCHEKIHKRYIWIRPVVNGEQAVLNADTKQYKIEYFTEERKSNEPIS